MGLPLPATVGASGLPPTGDFANAVVRGVFSAIGPGRPFEFVGSMNVAFWAAIVTTLTTTNGSTSATVASGTGLVAGVAINSSNVPRGTTIQSITGTAVVLALPHITEWGVLTAGNAIVTGVLSTNGILGATVSATGVPTGTTVAEIITPSVAGNSNVPPQMGTIRLSAAATASSPTGTANNSTPLIFAVTGNAVTTGVDAAASFTGAAINYAGSVQVERSFDGGATWLVCNVGGAGQVAVYNGGNPINLSFGEPERGVAYRLNCTALASGSISYRMSATAAAATTISIPSSI